MEISMTLISTDALNNAYVAAARKAREKAASETQRVEQAFADNRAALTSAYQSALSRLNKVAHEAHTPALAIRQRARDEAKKTYNDAHDRAVAIKDAAINASTERMKALQAELDSLKPDTHGDKTFQNRANLALVMKQEVELVHEATVLLACDIYTLTCTEASAVLQSALAAADAACLEVERDRNALFKPASVQLNQKNTAAIKQADEDRAMALQKIKEEESASLVKRLTFWRMHLEEAAAATAVFNHRQS
jgi:hypothetical protein